MASSLRRSSRLQMIPSRPKQPEDSLIDEWISIPDLIAIDDDDEPYYNWKEAQIKLTSKGYSVFSDELLSSGFRIPYGGILISRQQYEILCQTKNHDRLSYITGTNDPNYFIDAHPTMYPKNIPKNAWIGSFVNAPNYSKGEKPNARLYVLPKNQIHNVPAYRHILRNTLLLI